MKVRHIEEYYEEILGYINKIDGSKLIPNTQKGFDSVKELYGFYQEEAKFCIAPPATFTDKVFEVIQDNIFYIDMEIASEVFHTCSIVDKCVVFLTYVRKPDSEDKDVKGYWSSTIFGDTYDDILKMIKKLDPYKELHEHQQVGFVV